MTYASSDTQTSLCIRTVWSGSSHGTLYVAKGTKRFQADIKDWSDRVEVQAGGRNIVSLAIQRPRGEYSVQTAQMGGLIWIFGGYTYPMDTLGSDY